MIYVFDACALIAYLNNESGSDTINDLLKKAVDNDVEIYINIINLIEVHYANIRSLGKDHASVILEKILASPIQVISVISDKIFHKASGLKSAYKMSIADCIGLATALELAGQFVTSDHHELDLVAKNEPSLIFWFR